ncbi:hypothetical protein [Ramlibacter albus]|uniref:Lipoprotein n=1 Tax=Ramlibacter albus TaxID=2079448 RepID=A0A923S2F9_9BURK|nr:hypothetical protein [Ramlibacter albus]MBC5765439.1 hypothetical protein [Ramlibacter albus]
MNKPHRIVIILACMGGLAACGDTPQTASGIKSDSQHFTGTGKPYQAAGWKQGDRNSWEQQLKVRAQQGQNDYVKVN